MAYDLAKVTANGNNLIAQILANKSSLSIDKIEISDTQLPSTTDISTMTSVPKVVQTVSANGFSKNSNTLIISTVVDNSSIRADYKAWVFGIWGSDSQNGQSQLIAVITSTNSPDTIPAFSGRTPVSYTYKFNIGFSNASQIKFNMINDSFATNDTVVHTTGDETVDGKKTFKVDPVDKNGDAYGLAKDIATKVTDNKDGTEQLNGVQVQPFNKLTDVEDHRNYLTGTANDLIISANVSNFNYYRLFYPLVPGEKYTFTSEVTLTGTANNVISVRVYQSDGNSNTTTINDAFVADGTRHSWTFVCPSNGYYLFVYAGVTGNTGNIGAKFHHSQLELGLPTPWHEAISDKQDKIGYKPADDSKVVHDNHDNTITANSVTYDLSKSGLTSIGVVNSGSFNDLPLGTAFASLWMTDSPNNNYSFITTTFNSNAWGSSNKVQIAIANITNLMYFRVYTGSSWNSWTLLSDDSKVAHLSGANNFDTVPTVNNNPLLLASSLPPDLARTGQAQTFTAAQTFSIAPIDKTTGNPYITYGVATNEDDAKAKSAKYPGVMFIW